MNAAKFVKNFLLTANEEQNGKFTISDVSGAMSVVEQTIRAMADADNEDAQLASTCLDSIWMDIWAAYDRGGRSREMSKSNVSLSVQDRMALRTAERLLDQGPEQYPQERRDDIRSMIDGLPSLLNDLALPQSLKEYIARLAREVRIALDEYDLTGDFKLDIAFTRLQTSLSVAATVPQDDGSREKLVDFLKTKVVPCLAAGTFALGAVADGATVLDYFGVRPQISSSQQTSNTSHAQSGNDIPQDQ